MIKVHIYVFKKIHTQRDEAFPAASRPEGRTDRQTDRSRRTQSLSGGPCLRFVQSEVHLPGKKSSVCPARCCNVQFTGAHSISWPATVRPVSRRYTGGLHTQIADVYTLYLRSPGQLLSQRETDWSTRLPIAWLYSTACCYCNCVLDIHER